MKTLERLVAEKLLKIKAVKLQPANPFTWASGWKSPIYCDNRKTLSYPAMASTFSYFSLITRASSNLINVRTAG
jgi:orotate phosphoribosyltransferase